MHTRRIRISILIGFFSLLLLGCGAPPEAADLILTNARVIDGTGVVHDSAIIAITGKRIQSITSGQKRFNARETIDAQGKTVLPGLINTHVHLRPAGLVDEETLTEYLKNDFLVDLQDYLEHGITTLKSAGDPAEILIQVRERLARGEIRGPRLFLAGPTLTAVGGHPAATLFADNSWLRTRHVKELSSEAEARAAVRQLAEAGVDAIKFVYQGSTDESKPYLFRPGLPLRKMTPQMMEAIIDEAHQHQLPVTAHTNDLEDALAVLEAGCDGLEHGVTRMRLEDEKLGTLLRERQASYVPTLRLPDRRRPEDLETAMANLRQVAQAGGRVVLGTDGIPSAGGSGLDTLKELELMVEAGVSPQQVIEAATRNAAEHLGKLGELGTLEPGALADLIIVEGDPLTDIRALHNIEVVIKGGEIVVDNRR